MSILEVDCSNLHLNPACGHGPTLKFSRLVKGQIQKFYSCSACRSRKDCPFFLVEGERVTEAKRLSWDHWAKENVPKTDFGLVRERLAKFQEVPKSRQLFCIDCFDLVLPKEKSIHLSHSLNHVNMARPSTLINPLQNNKKEAQYWFSDDARQFLVEFLKSQGTTSVVCLGVPTLHESLSQLKINSLLLDMDPRYHYFYTERQFVWFNMMNFHFMGGHQSEAVLREHLRGSVGVVLDPPFGARIEPLARTISLLKDMAPELFVVLILPYFMEPQVLRSFPDFEMLDYSVNYENHSKFKEGSPVKIFTNGDASRCAMPAPYWFCGECSRWRSPNNRHCSACHTCPSKNGKPYRHCDQCQKCVKSTWTHCNACGLCYLKGSHECTKKNYQSFKKLKKN